MWAGDVEVPTTADATEVKADVTWIKNAYVDVTGFSFCICTAWIFLLWLQNAPQVPLWRRHLAYDQPWLFIARCIDPHYNKSTALKTQQSFPFHRIPWLATPLVVDDEEEEEVVKRESWHEGFKLEKSSCGNVSKKRTFACGAGGGRDERRRKIWAEGREHYLSVTASIKLYHWEQCNQTSLWFIVTDG